MPLLAWPTRSAIFDCRRAQVKRERSDDRGKQVDVALVGEKPARLGDAHPAPVVHFVAERQLAAGRLHPPVADALWTPTRVRVRRRRQLLVQRADEAGLFFDLPQRALLVSFARLGLPFGKRPVVVVRAVDHEHGRSDAGTDNDASCRSDHAG